MEKTAQELIDEVGREEKSRKKKRQPYRKSSRMGKRGAIPFLIPIIFIALTLLFLVLLIKAPEICLFGKCWRLIPLRLSRGFLFWVTFTAFFLINAGIVWIYWKMGNYALIYVKKAINMLKNTSIRIEKWFLRISQ